jgi:hypothetical protein
LNTGSRASRRGAAASSSNATAARALSWSAKKKRIPVLKPVSPVSFYGAKDQKDLKERLSYLIDDGGVLIPSELHQSICELEQKVQAEVKRIQDCKKQLESARRKVSKRAGEGSAKVAPSTNLLKYCRNFFR